MTARRQRVLANIARAIANVHTFADQGNWTYPAVFPLLDKSPAEAERCEQLVHALAEACGYPVEWFDQSEIPASGNWDGETIALTNGHPWATTLRVLAHELGHAVSGTDDDHWLEGDLGVTEIVAEAFCQELCRRLGLDTSPMSDPYIRGWQPDSAVVVERYREQVSRWVDGTIARVVDAAGTRFLTFAEKKLATGTCYSHGLLCPDLMERRELLRAELHRPFVLDFLGRDFDGLCRIPIGPRIIQAIVPTGFEPLEPLLSDDELVGLLAAWSNSLEGEASSGFLRRSQSAIVRSTLFPRVPMPEAAADRWVTFLAGTLGTDGLFEWITTVNAPREHYAGAALWRFASDRPDALKALLSTPPAERTFREAIFRQFAPVILADAELAVSALNNGWVPASRRQRVIERLASDAATDPLELLALIADDHPAVPRALDALAAASRPGVSAERARRIIREVNRFPGTAFVIDAVLEGVSVGDGAADFTALASEEHGRVVGGLVARRLLERDADEQALSGWDAVSAMRHLRLSSADRAALAPIAARLASGRPSILLLESLLDLPEVPRSVAIDVAKAYVRDLSDKDSSLRLLRIVVARHSDIEGEVLSEARRIAPTSRNSALILDVLELPSSGELDEALVLQAMKHTVDREILDRLLALVTPGAVIHRKVAERVAELYPSHPVAGWCRAADVAARQRVRSAERAETIARLSTLGPTQRLIAVLADRRDVNYWPEAWASVDDGDIEALTRDERDQLARRLERGTSVWRELGRRLRTTKEKR